MLKFFRTIRKKLIEKDNVRKYLLYAIGEILLVVIGILIALQVNNWNNDRIKENRTQNILNLMHNELSMDISVVSEAIDFYLEKDSLIQKFRETDFDALETDKSYFRSQRDMIRTYDPFEINDRGYELLTAGTDELDSRYADIILDARLIYEEIQNNINRYKNGLEEALKANRDYKALNYPWYHDGYLMRELNEDEIAFYTSDPMYKNQVAVYREYLINIVAPSRAFLDRALKLRRKLSGELGIETDRDENWQQTPDGMIEKIAGTYRNDLEDKDLELSIVEGVLANTTYESDSRADSDISYNAYYRNMDMRYLGDSIFYLNDNQDLRLNADGIITLLGNFDRDDITLTRLP